MLFKKRFNPDLIDLVKYEGELLYQQKHGIVLRPPPSIPGLIERDWSDSEIQAMRDNREKAEKTYNELYYG